MSDLTPKMDDERIGQMVRTRKDGLDRGLLGGKISQTDHDRGVSALTHWAATERSITASSNTAEIDRLAADGWIEVTDAERKTVCAGRPIFNGCTFVYLKERYGADNVQHVTGINWFRREA